MVAAAELSHEGAQAGWPSHVVSETELPELEVQSAQRRAMASELALIDKQLAQAASRPLDRLRAELAGRDLAELDAGRQQAEQAGDAAKPIGVPALSEGTADQLYLALRLAALGLRHGADAAAPVMPLVLDDVLMTADDERAACILQALAAHARTGQVLLFTHHRHLIELARERLDGAAFMVHRL